MQGVLGAGQAGIIVSQSSHRNQFIALLGGGAFLCLGEKRLMPRGPWGRAFWRYIFGLFLQEPKQAKKRTPTMLKNPPGQQRITSIIGGTLLQKTQRSLNTGSPNDQASLDMM